MSNTFGGLEPFYRIVSQCIFCGVSKATKHKIRAYDRPCPALPGVAVHHCDIFWVCHDKIVDPLTYIQQHHHKWSVMVNPIRNMRKPSFEEIGLNIRVLLLTKVEYPVFVPVFLS